MKVGVRVPNISKRIKARTTGKLKRQMKKAVNPFYGEKGMGLINNPKKAVYNKVYNKTTVSPTSKKGNELLIHIGLFIFTAGIGNIIYLFYKNPPKNLFNSKICPICNNTKISNSSLCCKICKQRMLLDSQYIQSNISRFENDISRGYKRIEPYLSRYQLILEEYKKVYEYKTFINKNLTLEPDTYEELEKIYHNRIINVITEKKQVLIYQLENTGEEKFYRDIKKLRDEILEMKIKYPQFKDLLIYDELQNIIDEAK